MAEAVTETDNRAVGVLAIATGIAGFGLLAIHPGGEAKTFADVLQNEAANRAMDAVVHGGFIIVLALQLVSYAVFSRRLGLSRVATVAGIVLFAVGAAFLAGSMLMDGLVLPAVAAKYAGHSDKIEQARTIYVLGGTMISFLMPIGLTFQSAAIAAWGAALIGAKQRVAGMGGLILGAIMLAIMVLGLATMNAMALMAGISGTGLWALVAGGLMASGKV